MGPIRLGILLVNSNNFNTIAASVQQMAKIGAANIRPLVGRRTFDSVTYLINIFYFACTTYLQCRKRKSNYIILDQVNAKNV